MPLIQTIQIHPVSFRLKSPFITAAGKKSLTPNVQVIVTLSDNTRGYGEASSSFAMPEESQPVMSRVIKELVPEVRGKDIEDYRAVIQACWRLQPYHPTAVSALESALLDAYCRWRGQPLYQFLGNKKKAVETDLTLSVGNAFQLQKAAKAAWRKGFRRFKVKLGADSPQTNAQRIQAVHRAAPKALLVADGNQGLNTSQALDFIRILEKCHIALHFLEQPFPRHDIPSMRHFRKRCRIPLVADESILTPADALRLFEAEAADGVNIKVAKSGLLGSLDIIQMAKQFKKLLAVGCMEESKLGLAASVHLACGVGVFDWVDLDSVFLLEPSSVRGGFSIHGPKLSVAGIRSGIGIA